MFKRLKKLFREYEYGYLKEEGSYLERRIHPSPARRNLRTGEVQVWMGVNNRAWPAADKTHWHRFRSFEDHKHWKPPGW